jgi:hypothetical protein
MVIDKVAYGSFAYCRVDLRAMSLVSRNDGRVRKKWQIRFVPWIDLIRHAAPHHAAKGNKIFTTTPLPLQREHATSNSHEPIISCIKPTDGGHGDDRSHFEIFTSQL